MTEWEKVGRAAAEVADHYNGAALVRAVLDGHREGLSEDALAARLTPMLTRMREGTAEDIAFYRRQLLAITTRAPVQ